MTNSDDIGRISVVFVVFGLGAIYVSSAIYAPPHVSLGDLDERYIGDMVAVEANVTDVRRHDGTRFLTLQEGEEYLDAVYFGTTELEPNPDEVQLITGEVNVYEGELELVIEDVQPAR